MWIFPSYLFCSCFLHFYFSCRFIALMRKELIFLYGKFSTKKYKNRLVCGMNLVSLLIILLFLFSSFHSFSSALPQMFIKYIKVSILMLRRFECTIMGSLVVGPECEHALVDTCTLIYLFLMITNITINVHMLCMSLCCFWLWLRCKHVSTLCEVLLSNRFSFTPFRLSCSPILVLNIFALLV